MTLLPNGYQTPNAYVDQFLPYLESDEWRVLTYAIRHIFGWDDKIDERKRRMSLSTFENGVPGFPGCGLSRPTISKCVISLCKFGLLQKVGKATQQGQMYELPIRAEQVDLDGLKDRHENKREKSTKRTETARVVNQTNRLFCDVLAKVLVNATNHQWLMRHTASGMSDILTQSQQLKPTLQSQQEKISPPRAKGANGAQANHSQPDLKLTKSAHQKRMEVDNLYAAVSRVWDTTAPGWLNNVTAMLRGKSKTGEWAKSNFDGHMVPLPEDLVQWGRDCGQYLPQVPAKIQKSYYDWLAERIAADRKQAPVADVDTQIERAVNPADHAAKVNAWLKYANNDPDKPLQEAG